ncbi:hypothetical protein NIES2101_38510 [Calothrix sp. HK-06]|nr:hypothetical protein NIES2101_38510 [Calothrix sp. HK-06]
MKSNLYKLGIAAMAAIISIASSVGIASAQIQTNVQINPQALKDSQISPRKPEVYGKVKVNFGHYASKGNTECKDLTVALYSDETNPSPPPPPGGIASPGTPIFSYSAKLSGNLSTGNCNYSISFDKKYVGKKARLNFTGGGNYNDGAKAVTLQNKALNFDTEVTFGNVG